MAKLKSKFWFGGRSSSSPEATDAKPSIVIHLYHDMDAPIEKRMYTLETVDVKYTAEALCIEVAKHLNIGSLAFHLFGLTTTNLQCWMPPNQTIAGDEPLELIFRLRFRPFDVDTLRKCSKEAFNYYFLQMRDDFLKNRIDEYMTDISLEKLLGLALLDLLRLAKELELKVEWIKNQDPERFIPKSSRSSMKWIWDKKRIEYNFRQDIEPKYKKHIQQRSHSLKSWYMNALRMYAPQYGCEKFVLLMSAGTLIVEPQKRNNHIYRPKELDKDLDTEDICSIVDLMTVSIREAETSEVQLDRRDGFPKVFRFEKATDARTFASCLEGYYRLFVDYHYTNLCNKSIYSPLLEDLASIRSYGPVDVRWARERLLSQHKANSEYNYLLIQKQDDLLSYDIFVYVENVQPKANMPPVAHFTINRLSHGKYQVSIQGEPMFDTMRDLLQGYSITRSKHKHLRLNRCVPVKQPVDPRLYLCLDSANDNPSTPTPAQSTVLFPHKYPMLVPSVQIIELNIAKGEFTNIHKASWEGEENEIITVAVKQLAADASNALEYFTQSIHQAAFWNHGTIISIHAVCLSSPLQVVMELAELGDMESYLRNPKKGYGGVLKVYHLVSTAEQIAQALTYLQEELANKSSGLGQVHGNVRCRNIMVCRPASESGIRVKLGDPGLIHMYNGQKIDHPVNHERLPWMAPELYDKMDKMTMFSDRYAFGITLWELFALAERPFGKKSPAEIMKNVLHSNLEKLLPKPQQCPEELYSTMRECCFVDNKESRMSPKDMVKEIRAVLFRANGREYSELSWQANEGKHYEFNDGKTSAEDALSKLLQQDVRPPSGSQNNVSFDMKSAPILSKHDMGPLTVNLDSKSHPVVGSPPNLREFGIHDSSDGQFTDVDTGLGASVNSAEMVNGTDLAPSINPKAANGGNIPMDPAIQRRPLPSVPLPPVTDEDRDSTIIARKRITIPDEKPLGQGHYGKVYKAQLSLKTGGHREIAIKSLKPKMINRFQKEFDREIKIMLKLKHNNIVEIIGQCPQKSETNPLLLLMEYLENGSMDKYLRINKTDLPDERLLRWTLEVAEGMKYLSDQKIIHRDLAARNVLISKDLIAKISDFGLSRILDPEKDYYRSDGEKEIPVRWCAPEVLAERKFAIESDVWSYGITVWEIFSLGSPPNLCKLSDFYSELHRGKRLGRPRKCPEPAWKRVILPCWEFYPQHRPAFGKICDTIDIVINEIENS